MTPSGFPGVGVAVAPGTGPAGEPAEQVWCAGAAGELVGILTVPPPPLRTAARPAVVFINAGVVHRVGPNRLYVNLARHLAREGFTCVRFDLSGIGDSPNRSDDLPADESAVVETREVLRALDARLGIGTFVLVGLCSGAVASFRAAAADERVAGAILLNPQGFHHDPEWNAYVVSRMEARRYVAKAMTDTSRWRRALSGQIDYRRLVGVLARRLTRWTSRDTTIPSIAAGLAAQFRTLAGRGVRLLVVCSDGDSSVDYMETILGPRAYWPADGELLRMKIFPKADHSLTLGASQRALFGVVDAWMRGFSA